MVAKRSKSKKPRVRENLRDDGLYIGKREIGEWSIQKYEILGYYCELFSSGMKNKWPNRVYIDALCGSGRGKVKDTNNIVETSPFMALRASVPFSHYIFCDEDGKAIEALKRRVALEFGDEREVDYIIGDVNKCYPQIINCISLGSSALKWCFLDPYDIGLHFQTVRELAKVERIDFLILLALYMDANRNISYYENPTSTKVENFLGLPEWREDWNEYRRTFGERPVPFLAEKYAEIMEGINYIPLPVDKMKLIKDKQLDLYYLALFSKDPLACRFWDHSCAYSDDQRYFSFLQ